MWEILVEDPAKTVVIIPQNMKRLANRLTTQILKVLSFTGEQIKCLKINELQFIENPENDFSKILLSNEMILGSKPPLPSERLTTISCVDWKKTDNDLSVLVGALRTNCSTQKS